MHEIVDAGGSVEGGAAAIADFGQVVALFQVGIAALRAALHGGGHQIVRGLDVVGAEVEVDLVDPVAGAFVVDQARGPNSEMARKRGRETNSSRPLRWRRPGT